jgi:hypothetical protein
MAQPAGIPAGRRGRMPLPRSGQPGDHGQGADVESVGISRVARAAIMSRALLAERLLPRRHRAQAAHTQCLYYRIHNDTSRTPSCRRWATRAAQELSLAS